MRAVGFLLCLGGALACAWGVLADPIDVAAASWPGGAAGLVDGFALVDATRRRLDLATYGGAGAALVGVLLVALAGRARATAPTPNRWTARDFWWLWPVLAYAAFVAAANLHRLPGFR